MMMNLTSAHLKMTMSEFVLSDKRIEITGLSASAGGGQLNVHVCVTDGEQGKKSEYPMLCEFWDTLGICLRDLPLEIDNGLLTEIKRYSGVTHAVQKAYGCISCSPCSEKMLVAKLCRKGIEREYAVTAADFVRNKGYIDEVKLALRECERCLDKYWGYQRIIYKLKSNGYNSEAMDAADDFLATINFEENCRQLLEKKYLKNTDVVLAQEKEIEKIFRSLQNYGYSGREIKRALNAIKSKLAIKK